jgi:LCP family protein required for cell wall assembly
MHQGGDQTTADKTAAEERKERVLQELRARSAANWAGVEAKHAQRSTKTRPTPSTRAAAKPVTSGRTSTKPPTRTPPSTTRPTLTPAPASRHPIRRVSRVLQVSLAFTALLGVTTLGIVGYEYQHLNANITRVQVLQPADPNIVDPGRQINAENYLLIGSDDETTASDGSSGHTATTMLIHLSPDRAQAIGISIPQASWVDVPTCKNHAGVDVPEHMDSFKAAYDQGGAACTVAALQKLTGIEVNHYVAVDFTGFNAVVDAIGSVTVCSPGVVNDAVSGLRLAKGNNELDGAQALAFVRARNVLGDSSDLGRIKRQQKLLGLVLHTAVGGNLLSDPLKTNSFLNAVTSAITLDQATTLGQLRTLLAALQGLDPAHVSFFTTPISTVNYSPPGSGQTGRVQLDSNGGSALYQAVINDATTTIRTLVTANRTITVASNGPAIPTTTTPGPTSASTPAAGAQTAAGAPTPTSTPTTSNTKASTPPSNTSSPSAVTDPQLVTLPGGGQNAGDTGCTLS